MENNEDNPPSQAQIQEKTTEEGEGINSHGQTDLETNTYKKEMSCEDTDDATLDDEEPLQQDKEDAEKKERRRKHRRRERGEGEEEGVGEKAHHHRKKKKQRSKTGAESTDVKQTIPDRVEKSISTEQQQQQQQPPPPQYHDTHQYNTNPTQQQALEPSPYPQQPPQPNPYPQQRSQSSYYPQQPQQTNPYRQQPLQPNAYPQQPSQPNPYQQQPSQTNPYQHQTQKTIPYLQQIPQIDNSKQPFPNVHYSHDPNNSQPFTITQQPQQFDGPQFQRQIAARRPPPNYMVLSWVVCLFCCWPIGIAAVISSSRVNNLYATGNFEEADRASRRAKALAIAGLLLGPILVGISYGLRMMGSSKY